MESSAYQMKGKSFNELLNSASSIYKVKVISAELSVSKDNNCGYDYKVQIISTFKNEKHSLSFRSFSKLYVGNNYLFFSNTEYLDAKLKYLFMGKNDNSAFKQCSEGETLFVSGFYGEIMEFDQLRGSLTGSQILKLYTSNKKLIKSLNTKKIVEEIKYGITNEMVLDVSYWLIPWIEIEKKLKNKKKKGSVPF